jgi:plasmid stabilization system protein ParE
VRVRFTPSARQSFLEVLAHIHREDAAAAGRFRGRAARPSALERFPDSGRKLPEFPDLPHREVVVPPYRFFYRVHGRTVWVVAVWHGAREVQEPSE